MIKWVFDHILGVKNSNIMCVGAHLGCKNKHLFLVGRYFVPKPLGDLSIPFGDRSIVTGSIFCTYG